LPWTSWFASDEAAYAVRSELVIAGFGIGRE
jgi:hypothetical protein